MHQIEGQRVREKDKTATIECVFRMSLEPYHSLGWKYAIPRVACHENFY